MAKKKKDWQQRRAVDGHFLRRRASKMRPGMLITRIVGLGLLWLFGGSYYCYCSYYLLYSADIHMNIITNSKHPLPPPQTPSMHASCLLLTVLAAVLVLAQSQQLSL
jgi:hypothetical protein